MDRKTKRLLRDLRKAVEKNAPRGFVPPRELSAREIRAEVDDANRAAESASILIGGLAERLDELVRQARDDR